MNLKVMPKYKLGDIVLFKDDPCYRQGKISWAFLSATSDSWSYGVISQLPDKYPHTLSENELAPLQENISNK